MPINPGLHIDAILALHFPEDAPKATTDPDATYPTEHAYTDADLAANRAEDTEARRLANLEDRLIDMGYNLDELDNDNPYN